MLQSLNTVTNRIAQTLYVLCAMQRLQLFLHQEVYVLHVSIMHSLITLPWAIASAMMGSMKIQRSLHHRVHVKYAMIIVPFAMGKRILIAMSVSVEDLIGVTKHAYILVNSSVISMFMTPRRIPASFATTIIILWIGSYASPYHTL